MEHPGPPPQLIGPPIFSTTWGREELAVVFGCYRATEFRNIIWGFLLRLSLRWPPLGLFRGFIVDDD